MERAGNESSFALCRLKLEEPMFRKISYLGFNLQRKEDERWKEFRNKGYFVSGIFRIVPPVPFVSSMEGSREAQRKPLRRSRWSGFHVTRDSVIFLDASTRRVSQGRLIPGINLTYDLRLVPWDKKTPI